ncbi:MAG TPA: GNAT family N-acetyltransferase [Jatrophihabitans sp.]|uniref:GNAT family N-acetyltransferase n=1 Tax=Jatrophihabitans sp. TaxID=1932789 RepID=UPI002E09B918|nr:GNAT family N-acetyltransferase [Jatrophihabitans sp.]
MNSEAASTYDEPARSFAGVWFFTALMVVGFGIDAVLSGRGAVTHLPGWLLAAALVIGVNLLVVHAARSTKSLHLTAEELRVGDEAIGRAEIVGVGIGHDPELPVLGWTTGMPRGVKGVTVRLFDDQDVVIPTRFPERLIAALGIGQSTERAPAEVRPATADDLARLPEIDERAETIFRIAGYDLPEFAEPDDHDILAVFVIESPAVGYLQLEERDGLAYIHEVAVIPKSMKQGLGSQLLEHACDWAREHGYDAITLTTYADVPWNAPFYARRGFVEMESTALGPELEATRAREVEVGLDAVGRRIAMRRDL